MDHTFEIPLYSMIPFILMLGSIAVFPIVAPHFWESNRNKLIISLILGIPMSIWLIVVGLLHSLEDTIFFDYIPFIILLGALFVITGGIYVEGTIKPSPKINTLILGIGAIFASFMGTTGASMLLIRPIIQANKVRKNTTHIILFFIAIVANCGGILTPLGDPPLFMMYLRGAPFEWFFSLFPEWLIINIMLLGTFYIYDNIIFKSENIILDDFMPDEYKLIKIRGKINFVWLLGVVLSVAFINHKIMPFIKAGTFSTYIREVVILLMALLSIKFTKQKVRAANNFSWEPIVEVAYLFLGIFITMVPCLLYLEGHAQTLGIDKPHLFYYAAGGLSSFLDNTPTAVTFHSLAKGLSTGISNGLVAGISEEFLRAISLGAVLFGSMTYIGNGPNFMVKAIAESQNIKMPNFFGYMYKFSLIILLPIFIIIQLIFI